MYRKILVPLDGSGLATGVLPYVRHLAGALKLPVELLSVNDPGLLVSYAPSLLRDYLDTAAKSFPASIGLSQTLENGNPANVIAQTARRETGTLVAMATHGYSGAARWLLGSVAEKVADGLTTDLLLVRPEHTDTGGEIILRTVLVPLDFSAAAEVVLPTVTELSKSLNWQTILIHVTKRFYPGPPEILPPPFGAIPNLNEIWQQDTAAATEYLTSIAQKLRSQGLTPVEPRALAAGADGPAGEIVDLAQTMAGSLIAMTPHGHSGNGRWVMGSVTRRVIQFSRRPVLIVRPPQTGASGA